MRGFLKIIAIVCVLFLVTPSFAVAKIYECETKQVVVWKHGQLMPGDKIARPLTKMKIRYDEESSTMWTGQGDGPMAPQKMEVLQAGAVGGETVVAWIKVQKDERDFGGASILRIRTWDKATGTVFLFNNGESLLSGKCKTNEDE